MLDAKHGDAFAGLYADLRGDAHAAAGRKDEARLAYQEALTKFDAKSQYRNYVQVKLESLGVAAPQSLGGPVPQLAPPPAAAATPPPVSAPPAAPAQPAQAAKKQ